MKNAGNVDPPSAVGSNATSGARLATRALRRRRAFPGRRRSVSLPRPFRRSRARAGRVGIRVQARGLRRVVHAADAPSNARDTPDDTPVRRHPVTMRSWSAPRFRGPTTWLPSERQTWPSSDCVHDADGWSYDVKRPTPTVVLTATSSSPGSAILVGRGHGTGIEVQGVGRRCDCCRGTPLRPAQRRRAGSPRPWAVRWRQDPAAGRARAKPRRQASPAEQRATLTPQPQRAAQPRARLHAYAETSGRGTIPPQRSFGVPASPAH